MLTVNTFLDRSSVHGIGLFTDQPIDTGELIWKFNPLVDLVFDEKGWKSLRENISECSFAACVRYSFKEDGNYIICIDNSQFMNHSAEHANVRQAAHENIMFAARPINPGEELLCNYLEYSDQDDHHRMAILTTGHPPQSEDNYR